MVDLFIPILIAFFTYSSKRPSSLLITFLDTKISRASSLCDFSLIVDFYSGSVYNVGNNDVYHEVLVIRSFEVE